MAGRHRNIRNAPASCGSTHLWGIDTRPRSSKRPDLWRVYREAYHGEPFVRIVTEPAGLYRYPEPKILAGTNFCDVGFALDAHANRVVAVAALDNLMKGAAGTAVQCMNLVAGYPETMGLDFLGLHPV